MEKWQAAHITKNLEALIKTTKCSAVVKAGLKARELLTDEEDERVTALAQNEGFTSAAKMLYEIMVTRTMGYRGLLEVLRDAGQDGALNILLKGPQQRELQVTLTDSITLLMSLRFQVSSYTKSFSDMFPNFTREDAREVLQNGDLTQELEEIFRKDCLKMKLDGELPVSQDRYIPRLLSNRLQLDPRVFRLVSCEDVFVFTNITRIELIQLVKPIATRSSSNQRSLVTGRHIYLDEEEDWDDMVAITESPIHLVSKEDDAYILQKSTKVTDVLLNYVVREGRSKDAFVTEDDFVDLLVTHNDSNGALICDVAGMGKTWLMQSLASKIRDKSKKFVVFFIELASFGKFLSELDRAPPDNQALTTAINYACHSKFVCHLLHKYAAQNGLMIMFAFDGYDELSKDDMSMVKSNLVVLSKLAQIRMIISSRPNMRVNLQKTFNLISYDILPFQTEEQVRCVVDQWLHVCPPASSELLKLEEFALKCIKYVKTIHKDDVHDFLGVPLKCRILATVNEKQAKQLCKANRKRPLEIVEATTMKSVLELYTIFVDTLVDKVTESIPLHGRNDLVNGIFKFYTHMALELLFPDLTNIYLNNCKFDRSHEDIFILVGVARFNHVKQRLEFIHRSMAEYFVGRFFGEFWNDIKRYSPSFVHTVGSYFVRHVLAAVDWAGRLHPIAFGNKDGWDFITCILGIGIDNLSSFLEKKKTFHLKYPLILLFMNQKLQKKQRPGQSANMFRNIALSVETEAIITTKSTHPVGKNTNHNELCGLKRWLAESSLVTMIACIDERLTNIFSLYVNILMSFFEQDDRVALLLPSVANVENLIFDKLRMRS